MSTHECDRFGQHDTDEFVRERARALRRGGRSSEAVGLLEAAVREGAGWSSWHDLGLALAADGRPGDGVEAYRRALESGGRHVAAVWVNLGNALRSCGRRREAVDAYRSGLARDPELAAAHYNLHAAVYDDQDPAAAVAALREALRLRPDHVDTRFYLGALLALHGLEGADELLGALPEGCDCLRSSLAFVQKHRDDETRLFADTFETLRWAVQVSRSEGLVVELGVRRGTSCRFLAGMVDELHGFDSFEGLPEAWGEQPRGLYSAAGTLPSVPDHVRLHRGWFRDVLPGFVEAERRPLRLVNVDCDLYGSTVEGLEALSPRIVEGTVLVFDEYLCNPGWEQEEHRAFFEIGERHGWSWRYVAFSLFTKQAVVRIC